MIIRRPMMSEGAARFWTAIFGGVTSVGLIAAGVYTLVEYHNARQREFDSKDREAKSLEFQIHATELAARQSFNSKRLDLCVDASRVAAKLAFEQMTQEGKTFDTDRADFEELYWGPLGIVEESVVAQAMIDFRDCLRHKCATPLSGLALRIAHACRAEVSQGYRLDLKDIPRRPDEESK